jgi:hypothetical protein
MRLERRAIGIQLVEEADQRLAHRSVDDVRQRAGAFLLE